MIEQVTKQIIETPYALFLLGMLCGTFVVMMFLSLTFSLAVIILGRRKFDTPSFGNFSTPNPLQERLDRAKFANLKRSYLNGNRLPSNVDFQENPARSLRGFFDRKPKIEYSNNVIAMDEYRKKKGLK